MMSEYLSEAYEDALKDLSTSAGNHVTLVVRSVIESKHILSSFEEKLKALNLDQTTKQTLLECVVDLVSNSIANMCVFTGKSFRTDILPLVDQITKKASSPGLHLQ